MAATITPYPSTKPQKGQPEQDFDNNIDAVFAWWLNSPADFDTLSAEVETNAIAAENAKTDAETALASINTSLFASSQVLADLTAKTTEAVAKETSLEADIATATAIQADIASNIASANLPSGVVVADAGKRMQVKQDGSGWEVTENLTLTNGASLKHGGTYIIVGAPTFANANALPTAGSVDGVSIKIYFVGDTVTTPIAFNPQAGEIVNGDAVGVDFAGFTTIEFFTYNNNWEYRKIT